MRAAMAALDARAARRLTAAAIAAALQGIFYWLILHEAVAPTVLPRATPLEVTILQSMERRRPATLPRQHGPRAPRSVPTPPEVSEPITPPQAAKAARPSPRAPIDWQLALQGEVRATQSQPSAGRLEFGFPRQRAPAVSAPQFGWDYAATHRLQPLATGGMLINLTDHCVLVVYGFIVFPGCKLGRIAANGHLFDRMRDRGKEP